MVTITELTSPHRLVRPLLGVGVLGGYTTFSTYSVEIHQMLAVGRPGLALTYLVLTPLAALAAVWLGSNTTRLLASPLLGRRGSRPSAGVNDGGLRFLGGHVRRRLRQFRRR